MCFLMTLNHPLDVHMASCHLEYSDEIKVTEWILMKLEQPPII